jgi:hypothetical protein
MVLHLCVLAAESGWLWQARFAVRRRFTCLLHGSGLASWHVGYILDAINLLGMVLPPVTAAEAGVWVSALLDMQ